MLGLRALAVGAVTEEQTLVRVLVDDMFVDRFRTFSAPDRIHDKLVVDFAEPQNVGDDVLDDAVLRLRSHPSRETNDSVSDCDVDVRRVEGELFLEPVAYEGAKLSVAHVSGVSMFSKSCATSPPVKSAKDFSDYRKNRNDAPSVRPRLFFQNDFACLGAARGGDPTATGT